MKERRREGDGEGRSEEKKKKKKKANNNNKKGLQVVIPNTKWIRLSHVESKSN